MTPRILISIAATLLLFGCSTTPTKQNTTQSKSTHQNILGGACAGFGNVQCSDGLECYLDAEAEKMDDANGVCRIKRGKLGEVCAGFSNTPCDDKTFCKREDGFDANGICLARPENCTDILEGNGVCGKQGNYYGSACYANLNGEEVWKAAPASKKCMD